MAHHESGEMSESMREFLESLCVDPQELGATGEFPDGKLTEKDEGALCFAVAAFKGRVVIDFGKPVRSIGMRADEARGLADLLLAKATAAERQGHR